MPLVDAALAFALTMLALSSLVGLVLDFFYSVFDYRRRGLEDMLRQLFREPLAPDSPPRRPPRFAAEAQASPAAASSDRASSSPNPSPAPSPEPSKPGFAPRVVPALDRRQATLARLVDVDRLIERVRATGLTRLDFEDLLVELRRSVRESGVADALGERLGDQPGDRLDDWADQQIEDFFRSLEEPWKMVGQRFTDSFREHARTWATGVALVLAFALNIDTFALLDSYMTDDLATATIVGEQDSIRAIARVETERAPSPQPGTPGADQPSTPTPSIPTPSTPIETLTAARQQAAALQAKNLAIGWSLFPSCPPSSPDPRCIAYWQASVDSFDLTRLDYEARLALDPPRRICAAVRGLLPGGGHEGQPTAEQARVDLAHTATEGGRGGGDRARARTGADPTALDGRSSCPSSPLSRSAPIPATALLFWALGCVLTGLLAGQGSPFWYEVVAGLGTVREKLRDIRTRSNETTASRSARVDPPPAVPPTPPGSSRAPSARLAGSAAESEKAAVSKEVGASGRAAREEPTEVHPRPDLSSSTTLPEDDEPRTSDD